MKATVLAWWVWAAIVAGVIGGMLLWAGKVHADQVYRDKNDDGSPVMYRKTDKPCTNKGVLKTLHGMILDDRRFRAGQLLWKGKEWASCWVEVKGTIFSWDEAGAPFQPLPKAMFKDPSV